MQGFNMGRYVPPSMAGTVSASGNKLHRKHPLGARARNLQSKGELIVRFEMPFPVWCETCPKPTIIGQGVRFNAAKRRVGRYHSTSIFAFRFRHAECGGELEIRTDPARRDYVVESGGRRREPGLQEGGGGDEEDKSLIGPAELARAKNALGPGRGSGLGLRPLGPSVGKEKPSADARETAFASLEKTIADRAALAASTTRVQELEQASSRAWENPYKRNAQLRRTFRQDRKAREGAAGRAAALKKKFSLADELSLGPELDSDRYRAALVDFGRRADAAADGGGDGSAMDAVAMPLFPGSSSAGTGGGSAISDGTNATRPTTEAGGTSSADGQKKKKKLRSEVLKEKTRQSLVDSIEKKLRVGKDPFLEAWSREQQQPIKGMPGGFLPGLKRKKDPDGAGLISGSLEAPVPAASQAAVSTSDTAQIDTAIATREGLMATSAAVLVDYDSE